MNTPKSLNFPEDLGYTARHVWARKDGDTLVIGITDFAQDQLGEILFVDLPMRALPSGPMTNSGLWNP